MLLTFALTVFAWIFFRANNLNHAINYISEIFSASLFTIPNVDIMRNASLTIILIAFFILFEWHGREGQYAIENILLKWKKPLRYAFYYALILAIIFIGGKEQTFIYFQF